MAKAFASTPLRRARGAACAALAIALLVALLVGLRPEGVGVLAMAALGLRALTAHAPERMAAIEALASVGFMAAMFGEGAAGAFALGAALFCAPTLATRHATRLTAQLALACALGAWLVCVAGALAASAPERWAPFAALAPALAAAAPRAALDAVASARLGAARWAAWRLHALAPLLVAMVFGAAIAGLAGAAAAWAVARLATPVALLVLGGRVQAAGMSLGALAAAFVTAIAGATAMTAGGVGAVLLAAPVFVLGLRVHAPGLGPGLGFRERPVSRSPSPAPLPAPAR